jgi:enoyl-CoA hydratase/carnithine racemase
MADDNISVTRRGKLAIITLERPAQLNAITHPMIAGIERAARAAEKDPEVAAICITGTGRGFCAGLDMTVLAETTKGDGSVTTSDAPLFGFLLHISKPVIAAVNGVAAGGGFVLAMMCDMRFFAEDASMTTVFGKRGLIAEHGTSWILPRIVGLSRALDLLWSSRRFDAAEAYRIGFADRVVKPAELVDAVAAYVEDMAKNVAPTSIAIMKRQVLDDLGASFAESQVRTARYIRASLVHPDSKEGARSFIERRPPDFVKWTGWQA